jgi:ATP-dependent RNA helicase TDRD12
MTVVICDQPAVHVIYRKMALREVTLLRLKEDGTFLVWAVSRGKNIPEEFRTVEKAIFRSLSTVKRNEAAVKFPSKHVTYLVEREPGVWSRGSVENVFQSSKGCLADVFFVDYGTKATLPHTRFLPMPSELEDYRHLAQHYILDGIEPVVSKQSKSTWGSTVMSRIRKLSKESSLLLKTVPNTTSNESGVQGAVLYTLDMRTNINELLVSEGLAQRRGHAAVARNSVSPTHTIERTDHFSTSQDMLQESLQSTEVSGVEYDPTIMVFSPRPLPPIYDLSQLGLPRVLEQKLAQKLSLSSIATHSWPFLLKEENLLGVCPPTGDYRMSYLLPLVSLQLKNRTFHSTTKGQIVDGPPIVVFLPNSHEVDKVSEMCQQLMEKCLPHERLTIVKCYGGIEAEVSLQLLNGCDLLLVTPSSLLRLVNSQRTTLHNLHHLVFDEANTIVDSFSEEIKVIIRKYVDAVKGSGRLHNLQVVAVTTECTPDVLSLMEAYGKHGREGYHMIVTCAIEAMVIGKPKLKVEQADFSKKLDCLTQHLQATTTSLASIVFVSSDQEQQEVVTFLQTYNYPVVKIANSQDLTHYKELLSSVQCIVLHDRVLPLDPSVLPLCSQVHYSLPSKVQVFRHRLSVAMKAFKTKQSDVEIMIFIDGSTTVNQMTSVTKLLKRMNQPVPDFLNPSQLSPADKWNSSQGYDLCYYFCAFGECKVGSRRPCRNLHSLSQLSTATNSGPPFYPTPSDGVIKFKACHVGNGSRLWIRILEHHPLRRGESPYIPPLSHDILKLHSEISKYFSIKENCVPLTRPKPGDCCVFITSEGTFHRAQIYDFDREINDFYHHKERAKIRLLDIGASEVVELNQLFQLPHRFTTQTRQVVECYVCNTKPNDQDKDFSIMALSFVKDKYEGKDLWGCILATHPGYLWLGTVEKREYLTGVGVFTSLSNWRKELLRQKMALDNPEVSCCCLIFLVIMTVFF